MTNQNVVRSNVELTVEKSASAPTFDFRGKPKVVNQIKEKPKEVEVKATEDVGFGKPKFDFRNRKS